jgi:hypothetical protein
MIPPSLTVYLIVIPDRTGREVSRAAARRHNSSLIAESEYELEKENVIEE